MQKMEKSIIKHFSVNYKEIIIDEIALNGLEGIGLDLLWRQVGKRLSSVVTEKMKARYWRYIINCDKVSFYRLPEPLPYVEVLDRFDIIDETNGNLKEPDDYLDGPYEFMPIEGEHGSCEHYNTRTAVSATRLQDKTYEETVEKYGDTLIMVADEEERWRALAPHVPSIFISQMNQVQYCLLELIGKARENGQMTIGKTNLSKIMKDSKTLFYIRKYLRDLDLIRTRNLTQTAGGKGVKSLLVRLKRFNQPCVLSMPKRGVLHNVVEYLLEQPDYSEKTEVIVKKGLITQIQNRKLQKTVNIFNFEDRIVTAEDRTKKTKSNLKRKYIYLSSKSDESSESDEESQEPPLKCQYKVGVSLMRQAYERFLDAGLEGLTQVQLAQLLGIEFYTSRGICRVFRLRNIVREYLEDRGKQRTARFIAIAATGEMDVRYAEEKKKFLEYLGQQNNTTNEEEVVVSENVLPGTSTTDEDVIPLKKIKLEKDIRNANIIANSTSDEEMPTEPEQDITEIKVLDGFEGVKPLGTFKKNPTLRQLTFANGVFKVLKDKQCICGYLTLSNLASKEINEPPLDTKALKSFIQKLVTDGHIKMYKIKWPGLQKYSVLICEKNVKKTDPLVKAKYKEICMRAVTSKKVKIRKENAENEARPLSQFSYPRYMKIQILHEVLMRLAYFEYVKPESHTLPPGFISIVDFIQEVTIEFVINNMGSMGMTEINQLITENQLKIKLKDAPQNIYKALLRSNNLQNAIRLNLKVLAMLGLIQLIRQGTQTSNSNGVVNYSSFLFFVNRHAKLIDTTGIWPSASDENITEKSFYFETYDDVVNYWNEVYQISTNTEIELADRGRKQLKPPQREEHEVYLYDNGDRYGDGNGPCGFDSCFYMEMPRLWRSFYMRPLQSYISEKKKVPVKKIKKKKKRSKPEVIAKPIQNIVVEKPSHERATRKRTDTSVKWTKQEDMIITMCKAAITILSPNSQPGTLIVRNIVAKDILSIKDPRKTKGQCHTRAATLDTNSTLSHEKQCIINEMRRRRNLVQKYEGLLKKLRIRYSSNMSKFINKARIPMMELIWLINEVMHSKAYIQKVPCIALNLEDFHQHFTIVTSSANKVCNIYKAPENVAMKEAIGFAIMQTFDAEISTETAKKIYRSFKDYPELSLRNAVEQLRKCGAIAAKEKIFNNQMRKLDLEDISQSSYKMSALYQRKWINRLNSEYTDNLAALLDTEQSECDVKGSAEINCMYCEMHACDIIDMVPATVPVITDPSGVPILPEENNVLTIDTKYRLKTGTLRLKNKASVKRLSDLYQDFDVNSASKYLSSNTSVDVKDLNQNLDLNDQIISHLNKKAEEGATFMELKNITGYEEKDLIRKLQHLESKKIAKRVGFFENILVLSKYIKPWSLKIGDKYIICTPWLKLNGKPRMEIFFKWCSVIMNLIFEKPGSSVVYMADKCEHVSYRAVQDICMFLAKYKCAKLSNVRNQPIDLFSDEDAELEFVDFNLYDTPENILAFPVKNSLTKISHVKKMMLDV